MDSFNKVISFVLGLVVVLVFFAVITGKINLKGKSTSNLTPTPTQTQKNSGGFFGFFNKPTTPTPTPILTQKLYPTMEAKTGASNTYTTSTAKSIPSTGLPTLFIPALLSGLAGGSFLRKAGKNKNG